MKNVFIFTPGKGIYGTPERPFEPEDFHLISLIDDSGNEYMLVDALTQLETNSIKVGNYALNNNLGQDGVAIGNQAASLNKGNDFIAIHIQALRSNIGNKVIGIGHSSGSNNTADNVILLGSGSGRNNEGTNVILIGDDTGLNNRSTDSIGIGSQVLSDAAGIDNLAIMPQALGRSQGSKNIGIGQRVLFFNHGDDNIVVGGSSYSTFIPNPDQAISFSPSAVMPQYNFIQINAHGLGEVGDILYFQYSYTIQSMFEVTVDVVEIKVSSANYLEVVSGITNYNKVTQGIYRVGEGVHTLTPSSIISNNVILGNRIQPKKSNQVMLGNDANEETVTHGDYQTLDPGKGLILTSPDGLIVKRIAIDNTGNIVAQDV